MRKRHRHNDPGQYEAPVDLHALAQTAQEAAHVAVDAQADFNDAVIAALEAAPVPPDPEPPFEDWPTPPRAPGSTGGQVTTISKKELPINIHLAPETKADVKIVSSSDCAVMVQPNGAGSVLQRIHAEPCCDLPWSNAWGRHGIYAKAENVTLEDFYAKTPGGYMVKNGISARMAGFVARRFQVIGFPLAVAFFNDGTRSGPLLFEDGQGDFTDSCAVYLDGGSCDFTFRHCAFTGPHDVFLAGNNGVFTGRVVIEECKVNGKAVTAQMVTGVPSNKLTIR